MSVMAVRVRSLPPHARAHADSHARLTRGTLTGAGPHVRAREDCRILSKPPVHCAPGAAGRGYGLRTVALEIMKNHVLQTLAGHLWPRRAPGGFAPPRLTRWRQGGPGGAVTLRLAAGAARARAVAVGRPRIASISFLFFFIRKGAKFSNPAHVGGGSAARRTRAHRQLASRFLALPSLRAS